MSVLLTLGQTDKDKNLYVFSWDPRRGNFYHLVVLVVPGSTAYSNAF